MSTIPRLRNANRIEVTRGPINPLDKYQALPFSFIRDLPQKRVGFSRLERLARLHRANDEGRQRLFDPAEIARSALVILQRGNRTKAALNEEKRFCIVERTRREDCDRAASRADHSLPMRRSFKLWASASSRAASASMPLSVASAEPHRLRPALRSGHAEWRERGAVDRAAAGTRFPAFVQSV